MAETHNADGLQLQRFVVNMVEENTYVVWDASGEAVIVDPGMLYPEEQRAVADFIKEKGLSIKHILLTHGHFDHVFGTQFLYEHFGVKPELHAADAELYAKPEEQLALFLHRKLAANVAPLGPALADGQEIRFGGHALRVIATPGHTPGGVCFYCESEGLLLSGDSLFRGAIGRCDLPGGNELSLVESLKARVLTLPDETLVCPGHGGTTHVGDERQTNFYLR